jgi:hypothetical protein
MESLDVVKISPYRLTSSGGRNGHLIFEVVDRFYYNGHIPTTVLWHEVRLTACDKRRKAHHDLGSAQHVRSL